MQNPEAGKVIPETGGLRKVRWGDPRRGKGKRGGLRIIYFYLQEASHIWLLTVCDKDEADDLTPKQKKAYGSLFKRYETPGRRREKTSLSREGDTTVVRKKKRNIGNEILEGLQAMRAYYEGKITLRTYKIEEPPPLPDVDAQLIRDTRERLKVSRRVFARQLRINERTLEKWEQGRAKPNKQAATLILLTRKFPNTLQRLAQLAA